MQEHKSRTSVLKIKKKCSIREIKYRSGGILFQIFPFFHVSKKRKNNNSNNIARNSPRLRNKSWKLAESNYETRSIRISKNLPRFNSIFTAVTSSSLKTLVSLELFPDGPSASSISDGEKNEREGIGLVVKL